MKRYRAQLLLLGLFVLTFGFGLIYARSREWVLPELEDLDSLSLDGHERLLVLAPHNDDELLGAGGLMLAGLREGIEIQVVFATNGDGSIFATAADMGRLLPHPADYILMGHLRQQESLNALDLLGIPAEQVIFLGYPDRGVGMLWNEFWSASTPFRSPYTQAWRSPYRDTYNPESVYAGEDLLADLLSIIGSYRPDLIIYPHPNEVHPDHWGLSVFTRLALTLIQQDDPTYQPDTYAYLIHRPDYPWPKGLHPERDLLPPPPLFGQDSGWVRLDLSEVDVERKLAAMQAYETQLRVLRPLMESFIRHNELFTRLEPAVLPALAGGDPFDPEYWIDFGGQAVLPVQLDPTNDTLLREMLPGVDLFALYASRQPDESLALCAEMRGAIRLIQELDHILRIKAVGPAGVRDFVVGRDRFRGQLRSATLSGRFVCTQISLAELEWPEFILVGAEVRGLDAGLIDQMGWQVVAVE